MYDDTRQTTINQCRVRRFDLQILVRYYFDQSPGRINERHRCCHNLRASEFINIDWRCETCETLEWEENFSPELSKLQRSVDTSNRKTSIILCVNSERTRNPQRRNVSVSFRKVLGSEQTDCIFNEISLFVFRLSSSSPCLKYLSFSLSPNPNLFPTLNKNKNTKSQPEKTKRQKNQKRNHSREPKSWFRDDLEAGRLKSSQRFLRQYFSKSKQTALKAESERQRYLNAWIKLFSAGLRLMMFVFAERSILDWLCAWSLFDLFQVS